MVPGSNLLNMALGVIGRQTVQWSQFTGRTVNSIGLFENAFATAISVSGSFQPIPRNRYENLGLDWSKDYVTFYVSKPFGDVRRDGTGDTFVFNGKTYQVMSNADWFAVDGWVSSMAVKV